MIGRGWHQRQIQPLIRYGKLCLCSYTSGVTKITRIFFMETGGRTLTLRYLGSSITVKAAAVSSHTEMAKS